jgi:hypothetical protein
LVKLLIDSRLNHSVLCSCILWGKAAINEHISRELGRALGTGNTSVCAAGSGLFFQSEFSLGLGLFELALLPSWQVTRPLESLAFGLLVVGWGTRIGSFFEPNFPDVGL